MDAWTVHGGRVAAACRAFGGAPADWLDLSTGISPHTWPGAEGVAIELRALPDPAALAALEAAAAAHVGADPARVCAVPGSEIALRLLGTVLGGEARHVVPSYATHAAAFARSEAIGEDAIEAAARAGGALLLANPNNPDGRRLGRERLLDAAHALARSGGHLVVDEAFADADERDSLAPHAGAGLPVVVLRSFGKFFGLAGVRLGFVLGPPAIVAAYRRLLGDWPISSAAIAIGTAAYRDRGWIAATRHRLAADAAALDALLARHGLAASGDCPLFRLLDTPDAAALFGGLARRRILARPFDDRPRWLRLGLPGSDEGLARLDRALADG